jgi:hypothetical protein
MDIVHASSWEEKETVRRDGKDERLENVVFRRFWAK